MCIAAGSDVHALLTSWLVGAKIRFCIYVSLQWPRSKESTYLHKHFAFASDVHNLQEG